MTSKYTKSSDGRVVLLADLSRITAAEEKEMLDRRISYLETQIDSLNARILVLEERIAHQKEN
jgi:hypothetical protein